MKTMMGMKIDGIIHTGIDSLFVSEKDGFSRLAIVYSTATMTPFWFTTVFKIKAVTKEYLHPRSVIAVGITDHIGAIRVPVSHQVIYLYQLITCH